MKINKEACRKAIEQGKDEDIIICAYYDMPGRMNFLNRLRYDHGIDGEGECNRLIREAMAYILSIANGENIGWNTYVYRLK